MKVLQLAKFYPPSLGGMETVAQNISEGLASQGDEVTALCYSPNLAGTDEWMHGVRVLRARRLGTLFSQPLSPSYASQLRTLGRLAPSFDVVNLHSPNPLAEAAWLASPGDARLVVTYHSDVVRQKLLLPAYSRLIRAVLKRADRIVVATENHIRHSAILPEFAGKCAVVPFGLDPERFRASPERDRRREAARARYGDFVLFVGRLVGYKGVEHLIRAMKEVPARLVIVGEGPLEAELKALSRDLGLADRVDFRGALRDWDDLLALYRSCTAFALPSVSPNEAFGMVLVEAMASARPLVSTRIDSGVSLVNVDGVTGMQVEPGNPSELARAIGALLADPALRERMGRAARARFEALYSREAMVRDYRKIYAEVTSS